VEAAELSSHLLERTELLRAAVSSATIQHVHEAALKQVHEILPNSVRSSFTDQLSTVPCGAICAA
jgi:hypothetical protein